VLALVRVRRRDREGLSPVLPADGPAPTAVDPGREATPPED
jgi:hypothetical protein